ncbi:hypothetical protein KEM56_004080, partial [Ascosphaera pollenicola]
FADFNPTRTVLRKFIPRNPNLDPPMLQTCHFYESHPPSDNCKRRNCLVVLRPHVTAPDDMPWYHPRLQALAFQYEYYPTPKGVYKSSLSLHFLPFRVSSSPDISSRLQRTLLSLLKTQARLCRKPLRTEGLRTNEAETRTPKDNILPKHVVQNRYALLKEKYAPYLMKNWVESTEPEKHVFEDLGIAAFLCELWAKVYHAPGVGEGERRKDEWKREFPGFVDVACGNGVLVYILHQEGYPGWGFDARKRKTWSILPEDTQRRLREVIYIPKPFIDAVVDPETPTPLLSRSEDFFDGVFDKETFIISNHADELTLWTPLIGVISHPASPMPFLAIPCCSHSLSGARYRFPPPKQDKTKKQQENQESNPANGDPDANQPSSGDLKALAAQRRQERADPGVGYSAYASLTARLVEIATEVGYADVEKTLLRIPSTRNIGVIGGMKGLAGTKSHDEDDIRDKVDEVVARECRREEGVGIAAKLWIGRAEGLQKPGVKLNGGSGHS